MARDSTLNSVASTDSHRWPTPWIGHRQLSQKLTWRLIEGCPTSTGCFVLGGTPPALGRWSGKRNP
jgi:hypothetical protein